MAIKPDQVGSDLDKSEQRKRDVDRQAREELARRLRTLAGWIESRRDWMMDKAACADAIDVCLDVMSDVRHGADMRDIVEYAKQRPRALRPRPRE